MENLLYVAKYYFVMLVLGLVFFPITSIIFKKFYDKGWMFSKIIGLGISAWLVWLLSYLKILKYTSLNCYIIVFVLAIINLIVFLRNKEKMNFDKKLLIRMLGLEALFFCALVFWGYVRSFSPGVDYSTEKFMNYGFLNQFLNTEYLPAQDMWFSGHIINYYYFGQYIASFAAKLVLAKVNEAFNLYTILINAFSFVLPLSIGYNLAKFLVQDDDRKIVKFIPSIVAVVTGLAVSIGGTLYFPIYNLFVDRTKLFSEGEDTTYYWTEDIRYIGYRPETNDKTINEILPASNVISDLHAHHLDTIFAFLIIGLALEMLVDDERETIKRRLLSPNLLLIGVIIAIQKMTNFWDFPIYFVFIGITLLFANFRKYKFNMENVLLILTELMEIFLIQFLASLPFSLDFHVSASKICISDLHSPIYKWLVLWGLPTFSVLIYMFYLILEFRKSKGKGNFFKRGFAYIDKLGPTEIFALILGCCGIGLVLIPELVYVKDIYEHEYARANTVYKVCFQGEILFDIAVSYILVYLFSQKAGKCFKIFSVIGLVAFLSTFGYGINAIMQIQTFYSDGVPKSLLATESYIQTYNNSDYWAIQWIKNNINNKDVILEKADGSYNHYGKVAVFTGNPSVLAWHGHEWIWRAESNYGVPPEEDERWNDIWQLYNSADEELLKELIKKYNISYVYYETGENLETLLSLGELVYVSEFDEEPRIYIIDVRNI